MEIHRPGPIFRLYTFILFFVLLADVTSLLRGRLRDVLLIVTSLMFGLTLVEAAVDFLVPQPVAEDDARLRRTRAGARLGATDIRAASTPKRSIRRQDHLQCRLHDRRRSAARDEVLRRPARPSPSSAIPSPSARGSMMPGLCRRRSPTVSAASCACSISAFQAMDRSSSCAKRKPAVSTRSSVRGRSCSSF